MSGKAFAIIGMRGMGKTFIVKKLVSGSHPESRLIYDPNNEYGDLYPYPLLKFNDFARKVTQVKNAVIVVEEATIFLNNRGFDIDFVDTIVRARHTNNTIILVFHSLRALPKYIFDLMNYVVLLKTNDNVDYVEKEYRNEYMTKNFLEIKSAQLLENEEGRKYSPHKILDLFDPQNYG